MSESTAKREVGTPQVKRGMAQMLKGGVIMDVVTPEQAKIAEDAGADLALSGRIAHVHSCSSSWARTSSDRDMFV